jgi:hypothetical protein
MFRGFLLVVINHILMGDVDDSKFSAGEHGCRRRTSEGVAVNGDWI